MIVSSRRPPPQPPHELQNSIEKSNPMAPTIIRMIPTVFRLIPSVFVSTANARIAPIANRKMLTPIPTCSPSFPVAGSLPRSQRSLTLLRGRSSRRAELARDRPEVADESGTFQATGLVVRRPQDRRRMHRHGDPVGVVGV